MFSPKTACAATLNGIKDQISMKHVSDKDSGNICRYSRQNDKEDTSVDEKIFRTSYLSTCSQYNEKMDKRNVHKTLEITGPVSKLAYLRRVVLDKQIAQKSDSNLFSLLTEHEHSVFDRNLKKASLYFRPVVDNEPMRSAEALLNKNPIRFLPVSNRTMLVLGTVAVALTLSTFSLLNIYTGVGLGVFVGLLYIPALCKHISKHYQEMQDELEEAAFGCGYASPTFQISAAEKRTMTSDYGIDSNDIETVEQMLSTIQKHDFLQMLIDNYFYQVLKDDQTDSSLVTGHTVALHKGLTHLSHKEIDSLYKASRHADAALDKMHTCTNNTARVNKITETFQNMATFNLEELSILGDDETDVSSSEDEGFEDDDAEEKPKPKSKTKN